MRQRYADLIVRQEARDMVRTKATALQAIRHVLAGQGYLEIETPIIQLIHGGAAARPFRTHMNAFDQEMVLRIALELNLKKAVVGGVDRVYELGRIFRNEGVDATHSPEFTMLEAYQAWGDQSSIGALMRDLYLGVADALGSRVVETPRGRVDLDLEWRWLPVYEAVSEAVGEQVTVLVDGGVRSGLDVVKFLALGARACLIGRPWAYAVAARGEEGVVHVLDIIRDEMQVALGLTGINDVADLTPDALVSLSR